MEDTNTQILDVFKKHFPLVADGTIELKGIARQVGARALISFYSNNPEISPLNKITEDLSVLETIEREIGGDKLFLFLWNDDPRILIKDALDLFLIDSIDLDDSGKTATIKISDKRSLEMLENEEHRKMIPLAEKISGWKINIVYE